MTVISLSAEQSPYFNTYMNESLLLTKARHNNMKEGLKMISMFGFFVIIAAPSHGRDPVEFDNNSSVLV
jgi:hypothetical protein